MDTKGELEVREIQLNDSQKLRVALKSANGGLMIDARKWIKYPNLDDYVPTKKGLMIDFKSWNLLMPLVTELIASQSAENESPNE